MSNTARRGLRRATAVAMALAALTAGACGGGDEGAFEKTPEGFNIEPAAEVGPHAFTPSVASDDVKSALGVPEDGGELAQASPGACDTDKFLKELQSRPDAHREWARVLGLKESEVATYVKGLRSTVLTADTKVTNHGLKDGRAYPRASVLTAGTAVLVDDSGDSSPASTTSSSAPAATAPGGGVIVTRCKCGNPLLPPVDPKTIDEEPPATEAPGTSTPGSTPGSSAPGSVPSTTSSQSTTTRAVTSTTGTTTSTSAEVSTTILEG